jgi:sulfide:quinone oxidoreductase
VAKFVKLDPQVSVSPQLVAADFAEAAARGFRSVVNNRPDGEAADQLPNAEAAALAQRHGLEYRYQPVRNVNVTDDDVVAAFERLLDELPAPILFYCRSGTRCTTLWTQVSAPRLGVDAALQTAREAGYNLEPLRDTLEARTEANP